MNKIQSRIGYLFSGFILALFLIKVALCLVQGRDYFSLFSYPNGVYWIIGLLFVGTAMKERKIYQILQCVLLLGCGIWILSSKPNSDFFGLAMIILSTVLAFAYRIIYKHLLVSMITISLLWYGLFVTIPLYTIDDRFIHGFEWVVFIDAFLFVIWAIFKDSIEKLSRLAAEASAVARDALALEEKRKEDSASLEGK